MTPLPGSLTHQSAQFLQYLESQSASVYTLRNYRLYYRRYHEWYLGTKSHKTPRMYKKYLVSLGLSKRTVSFHLIALRSLMSWLISNNQLSGNPKLIKIPKAEKPSIVYLSGKEVDKILRLPDLNNKIGKRDRAILETLFATGLRVSELVSLNCVDVDLEHNTLTIENKRAQRCVFLSKRAGEYIENYLSQRLDNAESLFISYKGRSEGKTSRMTARSVQRILKSYVVKAGVNNKITPKTLRYYFATDLIKAGENIKNLQKMLGHKSLSSTMVYKKIESSALV